MRGVQVAGISAVACERAKHRPVILDSIRG